MGPLVAPTDDMEGMGQGQDTVYFCFPDPENLSPPILQADQVTFGYTTERTILSNVNFFNLKIRFHLIYEWIQK